MGTVFHEVILMGRTLSDKPCERLVVTNVGDLAIRNRGRGTVGSWSHTGSQNDTGGRNMDRNYSSDHASHDNAINGSRGDLANRNRSRGSRIKSINED